MMGQHLFRHVFPDSFYLCCVSYKLSAIPFCMKLVSPYAFNRRVAVFILRDGSDVEVFQFRLEFFYQTSIYFCAGLIAL